MITLTLTGIGEAVSVVLPKEVLGKLGVTKGDCLYLTEGLDGVLVISPHSSEVAREIAVGEEIMEKYGETFRALAK